MTSDARRNPVTDNLLTPENCLYLLIDYQPKELQTITSADKFDLLKRTVTTIKMFQHFEVPIIVSTLNIGIGLNGHTDPAIRSVLNTEKNFDRTAINAFEDKDIREVIEKTGRKKLIISGLWTESALSFPALDAMEQGYEVYPLVDTVGGTSKLAHETALRRLEQAGAQLTTFNQVINELQRDWGRHNSVPGFVDGLYESGMYPKTDIRK